MARKIISFVLLVCTVFSIAAFTVSAEESPKEAFIENVELLEIAEKLAQRVNYISAASKALDEYLAAGGSVTDEAIADHYVLFVAYNEQIEAEKALHIEFIDEVNLASAMQDDSYVDFKSHMNRAAEILPSLDKSFAGISASIELYNSLYYAFKDREDICDLYIEYATLAGEASTYADANKYVSEADRIYSNVTIKDYPGLEDARILVNNAKTFMGKCELAASPFFTAVSNVQRTTTLNLPKAIKDAYALLETIDETTVGVDIAVSTLNSESKKYDRIVNDANAAMEEIGSLSLAFIF